jgi:hypothetical protein
MQQGKPISKTRRVVYTGIGLTATGLGIVGIVLPVMPTTIFLIIASAFFLRAHPGLHRWINGNRILGPYLAAYTQKRGLTIPRKLLTIGFLWVTIGFSALLVVDALWLRLLLAAIAAGVTIHLVLLKTYRPDADPATTIALPVGRHRSSSRPVAPGRANQE